MERDELKDGASTAQTAAVMHPWAAVVIPTYNGERYIARALDSLLSQQDFNLRLLETVVVDDGSTDGTLDIVRSYRTKLAMKIFEREHCGNWIRQTNFGISQCAAPFISILHQDDLWEPRRMSALRNLQEHFRDCSLYLHPSWFIDENGNRLGEWHCPFPAQLFCGGADFILPRLVVQNFVSMPAPLIRKDALDAVGPFDESLWFTADWDRWMALAAYGPWAYINEPLTAFRVHLKSQTITGSAKGGSDDMRRQLESVQQRWLSHPLVSGSESRALAHFSTALNVFLTARFHGEKLPFLPVFKQGLSLGPKMWKKYICYSRIYERLSARLRSRLRVFSAGSAHARS